MLTITTIYIYKLIQLIERRSFVEIRSARIKKPESAAAFS
jgi:hypothetical protein